MELNDFHLHDFDHALPIGKLTHAVIDGDVTLYSARVGRVRLDYLPITYRLFTDYSTIKYRLSTGYPSIKYRLLSVRLGGWRTLCLHVLQCSHPQDMTRLSTDYLPIIEDRILVEV